MFEIPNNKSNSSSITFDFISQVIIDWNALDKLGAKLNGLFTHAVLVYQNDELILSNTIEKLKKDLESFNIKTILYSDLNTIPNYSDINSLSYFLNKTKADVIIGFGGIDILMAVKTAALIVKNNIFAEDLIHIDKNLNAPLAFINIPMYPLLGEEFLPFWSLYNDETKKLFIKKESLLTPKFTFVDYSLLDNLSNMEVARICLAIIAISIDAMNTKSSNEMTNYFSIGAVNLIIQNLSLYLKNNQDKNALRKISLANLYSGLAVTNSSLGLCYSIAKVLNLKFRCDFNLVLSIILPHVMEYNLTLRADAYILLSKTLGNDISELSEVEAAIFTIETIRKFYLDLKLPKRLSELNISKEEVMETISEIFEFEFVKNNIREINLDGLERLINIAF